MRAIIGIRREDKNRWERRAPLTPSDIRDLVAQGVEVVVQPSGIRAFPDEDYVAAGARVDEDLSSCQVVLGVKEMPDSIFRKGVAYLFFAHVAKGQAYNMPMLKALLRAGAHLVDYEKVVDAAGRRLVFFGRHAGLAGAIDSLWALGARLRAEGFDTPLADVRPAHAYRDLDAARDALGGVAKRIAAEGLPSDLVPLVIGVAGYGNVAGGAVEILDAIGAHEIAAGDIESLFAPGGASPTAVYRVTFREEHSVERIDVRAAPEGAPFAVREFFEHPERFRGRFERFVPRLTVILNCIYWDRRYPRLVTKEYLRRHFAGPRQPRLRVIGDISCDIGGAIECTVKATTPDSPVYVWDPHGDRAIDGYEGRGPVVLAVDNLPCEMPVEASTDFGKALMRFVPALARADWTAGLAGLDLPRELRDAVIAYGGTLTPRYEYIADLW